MLDEILIINESELVGKHRATHEPYEYIQYEVTPRKDFNQCYISVYEIPPLKANYPFHYHIANTESFYIISGNGVILTSAGPRPIKPGDFIVCPPSPNCAHKILNTSTTKLLKYIDYDTTNSPDIVHYPDSHKTGIIVHSKTSTFFKDDDNSDYYKDE